MARGILCFVGGGIDIDVDIGACPSASARSLSDHDDCTQFRPPNHTADADALTLRRCSAVAEALITLDSPTSTTAQPLHRPATTAVIPSISFHPVTTDVGVGSAETVSSHPAKEPATAPDEQPKLIHRRCRRGECCRCLAHYAIFSRALSSRIRHHPFLASECAEFRIAQIGWLNRYDYQRRPDVDSRHEGAPAHG